MLRRGSQKTVFLKGSVPSRDVVVETCDGVVGPLSDKEISVDESPRDNGVG